MANLYHDDSSGFHTGRATPCHCVPIHASIGGYPQTPNRRARIDWTSNPGHAVERALCRVYWSNSPFISTATATQIEPLTHIYSRMQFIGHNLTGSCLPLALCAPVELVEVGNKATVL